MPITTRTTNNATRPATDEPETAPRTTSTTRRSILAATPLAAASIMVPNATLGQIKADQDLIAACSRYFELDRHFAAYGDNDIPSSDPALEEVGSLIEQITNLPALTLDGARAKASVAVNYGDCEEMERALIRDLAAGGAA